MRSHRAALALAALIPLTACHIGGGDQTWEFPGQEIEGVDLILVNGSIDAWPADDGVLRIEWSGGGIGNKNLRPEPVLSDGVIYIDARCGETCGGDFTVWLPEGMDLSGQVDKGDVSIELDSRADLRACATLGSVYVSVPEGGWDLDLQVGTGSLSVDGVTDDPQSPYVIEACTSIGDVSVWGRPSW